MAGPPQFKTYREKRKPKRLRGSHGNTVPEARREELLRRCGGRCEARASGECWGIPTHAHHRRMKSQRVSHALSNLLGVCPPCHRYIHDHVAESYERGWLLRSVAGPDSTGETT